ncbi:MAG: hypothetical protein OXD44_08010 [Gammaproteobacteria bacterium]|nr:hypothetical protein [Gammaproteobacteria bacterium]
MAIQFEHRLFLKLPWTISKVLKHQLKAMVRTIYPAELELETVDGTGKPSQSRPV